MVEIKEETQNVNDTKEFVIPKNVVASMWRSLNIVENELNKTLEIPKQVNPELQKYAEQWHRGQSDADKMKLRYIFAALGAPFLVADVAIMRGEGNLLVTKAVYSSHYANEPALLMASDGDNYRVRYLPEGRMIPATFVVYMDQGTDYGEAQIKLSFSNTEFAIFLALMDLYKRNRMISQLEHTSQDFVITYQDLYNAVEDGQSYEDPRWLLPFAVPMMPDIPEKIPVQAINDAVGDLFQKKILESEDGQNLDLTEAGYVCAESLSKAFNKISIMALGHKADGEKVYSSNLFIRGDALIWFVDITREGTVITTVTLEKTSELLEELFTPSGMPPQGASESRPVGVQSQARVCPKCGKPATWIEAYKRWYCYSCQEYLPE
jgi:ribosomal protein S27AE